MSDLDSRWGDRGREVELEEEDDEMDRGGLNIAGGRIAPGIRYIYGRAIPTRFLCGSATAMGADEIGVNYD